MVQKDTKDTKQRGVQIVPLSGDYIRWGIEMAYKEESNDEHIDEREVNRQFVERFPFLRVGDTDHSDENEYQRTWLAWGDRTKDQQEVSIV